MSRKNQNVIATSIKDRLKSIIDTLIEDVQTNDHNQETLEEVSALTVTFILQLVGITEDILRRERSIKIKESVGKLFEDNKSAELERLMDTLNNVIISTDSEEDIKETEVNKKLKLAHSEYLDA